MKKIVYTLIMLCFLSASFAQDHIDSIYFHMANFLNITGELEICKMNVDNIQNIVYISELLDSTKNPITDNGIYMFGNVLNSSNIKHILIKHGDKYDLYFLNNLSYTLKSIIDLYEKQNIECSHDVLMKYIKQILEIYNYEYNEDFGHWIIGYQYGLFRYYINSSNVNNKGLLPPRYLKSY